MIPYTLVILPGWGGSQETWKEFVTKARQTFTTVIVIELPCFGSTPCPTEVWGVEEYGDYVVKQLKQITSPEPVILLGHSFGGQVGAYTAAMHPNCIDRLVLMGAAIYRKDKKLKRFVFSCLATMGNTILSWSWLKPIKPIAKTLLYKLAASPDYTETSGIKRDIYKKIIRQDVSNVLPSIKLPTLIIWGDHDGYVPVRDAKHIQSQLSNAQCAIIQGGKHGLHHTHSAMVIATITSFLEQ